MTATNRPLGRRQLELLGDCCLGRWLIGGCDTPAVAERLNERGLMMLCDKSGEGRAWHVTADGLRAVADALEADRLTTPRPAQAASDNVD